MNDRGDESELGRWEGEGGHAIASANAAEGERPSLPSGYEEKAGWDLADRTGRSTYEFNRVYRSPVGFDKQGPAHRLDEEKSYWRVTSPPSTAGTDGAAELRFVTFAQARRLRGPRFTFARFSTPVLMGEEIAELLRDRRMKETRP